MNCWQCSLLAQRVIPHCWTSIRRSTDECIFFLNSNLTFVYHIIQIIWVACRPFFSSVCNSSSCIFDWETGKWGMSAQMKTIINAKQKSKFFCLFGKTLAAKEARGGGWTLKTNTRKMEREGGWEKIWRADESRKEVKSPWTWSERPSVDKSRLPGAGAARLVTGVYKASAIAINTISPDLNKHTPNQHGSL